MQIIAIMRGGGSADDLSCFNDERLVREIAASKIPVITGIGHEVDESLADLAADVRASTPSNVAEMLTKDRNEEKAKLIRLMDRTRQALEQSIEQAVSKNREKVLRISRGILDKYVTPSLELNREKMQRVTEIIQRKFKETGILIQQKIKLLDALNPEKVLRQGYAILSGKISPGNVVKITTYHDEIDAEIKKVTERKKND